MATGKSLARQATTPVTSALKHGRSMVASALRFDGTPSRFKDYSLLATTSPTTAWQAEAWRMYRVVGEFRYSVDWVGSMLSKATIHATEYTNGTTTRVPHTHPAQRIVDDIHGNPDGRAEMFRLFGIHFTVAGECWSVTYPDPDKDDDSDHWELVAPQNIRNVGSADTPIWNLHGKPLDPRIDPSDVLVVRYWRPDPLNPQQALAPSLGVLTYLGEIERASQHIAAQMDSRLAGAGILLLPSSMSLPTPPDSEGKTIRASTANDLMTILQRTMASSLANKGSAASKVPIVITADADDIAAAQHMEFWSDLDEKAMEMRNDAVRKLALGMDMPPEVLQGVSESNHWNAWQADESAIKAHTEPLLQIITSALADGILRPALRAEMPAGTMFDSFSIEADTSEMRLRPNRSKEALELFNLGVLGRKALLRETGFHDEDLMDEKEEALWLTRKVASGSTTPDLVAAALANLGVNLPVPSAEVESQEARPAPSLEDHPERNIPEREVSERRRDARGEGRVPSSDPENRMSALVAGADQIVIRALERAGNKLKARLKVGDGGALTAAAGLYLAVDSAAIDPSFLLDDAWTHVPALAQRHQVEPESLTASLNAYCEGLLRAQEPHDYKKFAGYITDSIGA